MTFRLPPGTNLARGLPRIDLIRWPLVAARELFELKYGRALTEADRTYGEIPVYGTNGQCGLHNEALFFGPGIIIGRKGQGPLGVEWCNTDFWVIDTAYALKLLSSDIDLRFAYFLVKYIGLNHLKDGTSNPTLSREVFGSQAIPLPPLPQQRAIAAILGALDDKIELNRRMSATLEAMARAIFKSWFVDFDPVRAKAEGRRPQGMDEATAALFPDRFGEDGLPEGWCQASVAEMSLLVSRGITPVYLDDGGIAVINQKCVRGGRVDFGKARRHDPTLRRPADKRIQVGDTLVNSTGVGTLGRVGVVLNVPESTTADSHVTIVRPAPEKVGIHMLGVALAIMEPEIEALGEGSTGQTELSRARVGNLQIVKPSPSIVETFDDLVGSLRTREICATKESELLREIRDLLLPRLVSGQLRVRDAERVLDAAVA